MVGVPVGRDSSRRLERASVRRSAGRGAGCPRDGSRTTTLDPVNPARTACHSSASKPNPGTKATSGCLVVGWSGAAWCAVEIIERSSTSAAGMGLLRERAKGGASVGDGVSEHGV
jgi:hypothetical protein